jgi:hypothetical protein
MTLNNERHIPLEELGDKCQVIVIEFSEELKTLDRFPGVPHNARALSPGISSDVPLEDCGQPFSERGVSHAIPRQEILPMDGKGRMEAFWYKNKGLAYVILCQLFTCLMMVATRLLEIEGNDGKGFHPLQVRLHIPNLPSKYQLTPYWILFVRMSITVALGSAYMYQQGIPGFPFGSKGVRLLLLARGIGGFVGIFAMYYSVIYLPVADVTVLGFLAPLFACAACVYFLQEPFTRREQMAALISLVGVVLIARPAAIFSYFQQNSTSSPPIMDAPIATHQISPR